MEDFKGSQDLHVDSSLNSSMSSCSLDLSDHEEEVMSSSRRGPLYELSDLMAQLPMKRGLSKFYDGKTQSFTCLTSVRSLEDVWKKERAYPKRWKVCNGSSKKAFRPKPTISKKQGGSSLTLFIFNGQKKGRGMASIPCSKDDRS